MCIEISYSHVNHLFVESGDIKSGSETKSGSAARRTGIVRKMGTGGTRTVNGPGKTLFPRQ